MGFSQVLKSEGEEWKENAVLGRSLGGEGSPQPAVSKVVFV